MAEIDLAKELADYGKERPPGQQTWSAKLIYPNEPVQIDTGLLSWGDYPPKDVRCAQCRRYIPPGFDWKVDEDSPVICEECKEMQQRVRGQH
jgi:hypothetical protein